MGSKPRGVKVSFKISDQERDLLAMMRRGMTIEDIGGEFDWAYSTTRQRIERALLREHISRLEGLWYGAERELFEARKELGQFDEGLKRLSSLKITRVQA